MKLETLKVKTQGLQKGKIVKIILILLFLAIFIASGFKLGTIISQYYYWQKTKDIYTASIAEKAIDYSFLKPFRNWQVGDLENLEVLSAVSLLVQEDNQKVIFEKNSNEILPIASLTKIMTGYVALKNYQLQQTIKITKEIVETEEDKGQFRIGEVFTLEELLYSMLIESSNDGAMAVAEMMGKDKFVAEMNKEAQEIGLKYTHFVDPVGLDPDFEGEAYNYSTAKDLALLVRHILKEAETNPKIAKLFEITRSQEQQINLASGRFHHTAYSTNEILEEFPEIIGAKTGYSPKAKECFLMVLPKPKGEGYLINVILGADNRFKEMKKIINWQNKAFVW